MFAIEESGEAVTIDVLANTTHKDKTNNFFIYFASNNSIFKFDKEGLINKLYPNFPLNIPNITVMHTLIIILNNSDIFPPPNIILKQVFLYNSCFFHVNTSHLCISTGERIQTKLYSNISIYNFQH